MFRRLLVANRGEIAARVIRTARRLGIYTIAVYSDADVGARHVRLADEAWRVGPAPARDSYLALERVLEVAQRARADAIHPGYGFLSERADFAAGCERAGIAFIGPPAGVIAAMGSKRAAKEAMAAAGVPVLAGYHGAAQSLEDLEAAALALGFPLIIKPSGGGGGKGMQIVTAAGSLAEALRGARRLATSAFGDPALLIERYLPAPRHVEVQVLCDAHGSALHLGTRDCSVQRRHQKLIEEAPAPGIPDLVRARLHAAGVAVARAVGYINAGTVEFLYAEGEFWFMEMNTRLQVEHGVTEAIFGLDLVEWQLRIAAGEPLPFAQDELRPAGHAVEVRVCAEDPAAGFVPSAGTLTALHWPDDVAGLRIDAGFDAGDDVPSHYDSLLGKLIGHGRTRAEAVAVVARGLDALRIGGVASNAAWLAAALQVPAFAAAELSTRFVGDHGDSLAAASAPSSEQLALAAIAAIECPDGPVVASGSPWETRDAFRVGLPAVQAWLLRAAGNDYRVELERVAGGWLVRTPHATHRIEARARPGGLDAAVDGMRRAIDVHRSGDRLSLWSGAQRVDLELIDPRHVEVRASAHAGELVARLPGTVVAVSVRAGDRVEAGAPLLVLEAMKMEHTIVAPHAGIVARIHFAPGDRAPQGALLIELAPADG